MGFKIKHRAESGIGLVLGSGHVTGQELVRACTEMVKDPRWEPGDTEVWDLSTAIEVDVSPDELDRLVESAHEYSERIGAGRCVFITARDGVEALLRLFELLTRDLDRDYHIARTRADAARWLGLDIDVLDQIAEENGAEV